MDLYFCHHTRLADTLLGTSSIHVEPWVAKLWSVVRKSTWKDGALDSPSVTVLINKVGGECGREKMNATLRRQGMRDRIMGVITVKWDNGMRIESLHVFHRILFLFRC